eukprot:CAMPEP_0175274304 /NCGR_PEP_ID=MMETSP0093-20121207/47394_1 /TAXON_ID=311494 /ORGANISM="Alexandrium monilatum, Strain CCMP3105" /LENGTH=78 /DNA_ID=CAMNT_0016569165 /DNA_START=67 /DNA_END=299 /DNA_ORIENTATION=+
MPWDAATGLGRRAQARPALLCPAAGLLLAGLHLLKGSGATLFIHHWPKPALPRRASIARTGAAAAAEPPPPSGSDEEA